jgi:hypothetical protein
MQSAKRVLGYFALAVLVGDEIAAAIDLRRIAKPASCWCRNGPGSQTNVLA